MGYDPSEVVNIRIASNSAYKKKFGLVDEWKEAADRITEVFPLNDNEVTEAMLYYLRERKRVGAKRSLPIRYKDMSKLWNYFKFKEDGNLSSRYIMATTSILFSLWLRIDKMVKLMCSSVRMDEQNEEKVPFILFHLADRKYMRRDEGQTYSLYIQTD